MFVIREHCGCGAGVELNTEETANDANQIFAADFVNSWRGTHRHMSKAVSPRVEDGAHVQVDALVERSVGFQLVEGEVRHG